MGIAVSSHRDIRTRFSDVETAVRYRDRWQCGKRRRTHLRESEALAFLLAELGPIESAVDIGSGTGRLASVLAAHSGHLLQLDVSRHMLEVARKDPIASNRGMSFTQGDCLKLPLRSQSVDLVFCHRLLNHLPSPQVRRTALSELGRVSRCHVVVSCLSMPWPVRAARQFWDRLRGRTQRADADGHVSLSSLLKDAAAIGLELSGRTQIRSGLVSAEFVTFESRPAASPDVT